jgi:alpha-L-fucosidase
MEPDMERTVRFGPKVTRAAWVAMLLGMSIPSAVFAQRGAATAPGEAEEANGAPGGRGGFGMGPPTRAETVAKAAAETPPIPPGPFQPTWESIKENYKVPEWFRDGKFGIMIHWGLYSVPAFHNEWYQKYMYGNAGIRDWHIQNFGPLDQFGYIKFADSFATKFDAGQWAALFKKAGATYVVPTAEHHDWFSLWDSDASPWNAAKMGPKRDLIGELAKSVRAQGMKFGVSNHSIEHYTFINQRPPAGMKSDLDDPRYADFYWVEHNDERLEAFLKLWVVKNYELIDKYQVDMLWFDNGINSRVYDPLKLKVAAYYYNRAKQWNKEVSISTKSTAYLAGSIMDYERQGRAPTKLTDDVWQPDDPIGPTFGYTTVERGRGDRKVDMAVGAPGGFVTRLVQNVSRNGNYLLNISPRGDGTIPENQQQVLLAIGKWLETNGDAIYGTRPWNISEEGRVHFTTKGDTLYAIALQWPGESMTIAALAEGKVPGGKVERVELLGSPEALGFTQDGKGLTIKMPAQRVGEYAFAFKISGLKLK